MSPESIDLRASVGRSPEVSRVRQIQDDAPKWQQQYDAAKSAHRDREAGETVPAPPEGPSVEKDGGGAAGGGQSDRRKRKKRSEVQSAGHPHKGKKIDITL